MENTEKFNGKSLVYDAARPDYPKRVYDILFDKYGFAECGAIADFGAGTGKFTQGLLGRGCKIYAVEPNADMLSVLRKRLPSGREVEIISSPAERTPLADCSIGGVTAAQAFHWFSAEAFKNECLRLTGGNAPAAIVYNTRGQAPLHRETYRLYRRFCPDFKGFSGGYDERAIDKFFCGEYVKETADNPLFYDKDTFIGRCLSSSYALAEGDENFGEFARELEALFEKYAERGTLRFPNTVEIYIGRIRE